MEFECYSKIAYCSISVYKNIGGTKLDYDENLHLVMLMYDLLE